MTDPTAAPPRPLVVYDVAAYRALAGDGADVAAAREAGRAAAARDRDTGVTAAASPAVLWALLADCIEPATPVGEAAARRRARRGVDGESTLAGGGAAAGVPTALDQRIARARAALAACVAHCVDPDAPARSPHAGLTDAAVAPHAPLLAPDPELALAHAVAGRLPAAAVAWGAYLGSLGAEVAVEGAVARLRGPLEHVRDRATQAGADAADEVQEVVVAAYDAAADDVGGWDEEAGVAERQERVVAAGRAIEAAIVRGRAGRGWHLLGGPKAGEDGAAAEARVAAAFGPGIALWREMVRLVVAGEVALGGKRWRETLWALQAAFVAGPGAPAVPAPGGARAAAAAGTPLPGPVVAVVTADPLLERAARAAGLGGAAGLVRPLVVS